MVTSVVEQSGTPLTDEEHQELDELDAIPSWQLTPEQSERHRQLMLRRCPPPTPEWEAAHYAKLKAQGVDLEAVEADFKAGNFEAVEDLLRRIQPAPRAEVESFERRINAALREMRRQVTRRPHRSPMVRKPRTRATRPSGRRTATPASPRAPGREPDPDEPSDDAKPGNRANVVDCEAEIRELLRAQATKARPEVAITCSYCHARKRGSSRTLIGSEESPGWWTTHECLGVAAA
jgi:hypothetical protein